MQYSSNVNNEVHILCLFSRDLKEYSMYSLNSKCPPLEGYSISYSSTRAHTRSISYEYVFVRHPAQWQRQQQNVYDIIITRAGSDCERRLASHVIRFYLHLRLTSAATATAAAAHRCHCRLTNTLAHKQTRAHANTHSVLHCRR